MGLNVSPTQATVKASPVNKRRHRRIPVSGGDGATSSDEELLLDQRDVDDDVDASPGPSSSTLSSPPASKRRRVCHRQRRPLPSSSSRTSTAAPVPASAPRALPTKKTVRFQPDDRLVETNIVASYIDLCNGTCAQSSPSAAAAAADDDNDNDTSTDCENTVTSTSSPTSVKTTGTAASITKEEIEYIKSTLWWTREEKRETIERNQLQSKALCQQRSLAVLSAQAVYQQICDDDDDEYYRLCVLPSKSPSTTSSLLSYVSSSSSSSSDEDSSDESDSDDADDDDESDNVGDSSDCDSAGYLSNGSHGDDDDDDDDDASDNNDDDDDQVVQEYHDQMRVTPLPALARGLEWGYLPQSKAFRKTHVRSVLKWQKELSLNGRKNKKSKTYCAKKTLGKRSSSNVSALRIFQRRTRASSRRSRLMARVLAETDRTESEADPNAPRSPPLAVFPKPRLPNFTGGIGSTSVSLASFSSSPPPTTAQGGRSRSTTMSRPHHFVGRRLLPMTTRRPRMIPW